MDRLAENMKLKYFASAWNGSRDKSSQFSRPKIEISYAKQLTNETKNLDNLQNSYLRNTSIKAPDRIQFSP